MIRMLLLFVVLNFPHHTNAEPQILTRWTEVMEYTNNAADLVGQFFLGGLSPTDGSFYVAGARPYLEKRSLKTGGLLWEAELDALSQSTWAISSDLLLGADVKGQMYGIQKDSGKVQWKQVGKGLYFSAPLIHEGRSYWINSYGTLSAHRVEDGAWLWQYSETATASLHLWSDLGPQIFSNLVLAGFPSGLLMAFEPVSGNRVWQESFGLAVEDSLSLNEVRSIQSENGYLIASSYSGNLKMWKAQGGSKVLLWEKRMSLHGPAKFDFEKQNVYVSDRQGQLHAIDLESGYIRWTQNLYSGLGTSPNFGRKSIWVGTSGGAVQAFDRETGKALGSAYDVGSAIYQSPLILENDEAIVLSTKGVLRRLYIFPELDLEETDGA